MDFPPTLSAATLPAKRVLVIAYYFPPMGGGGVQRSLKFVKYLPAAGYTPIVLSAEPPQRSRWAPTDPALVETLPPGVQVFRTPPIRAAEHPAPWRTRARSLLHLSTPFGQEWFCAALTLGRALCAEFRPELIFVSMSPFEGASIAAQLSQENDIPWVADLRDPWALDEMQWHRSGLHRRLECRAMRRHLRSAAVVVMNTPEAARRLLSSFPEYRDRRVISLTNGFDAADFAGPPPPHAPHRFTIVHTGTLHTASGTVHARRRRTRERWGQTLPGVDFRPRSHVFLVQALEKFLAAQPNAATHIQLILAGPTDAADEAAVAHSPALRCIQFRGYCSHAETVALQRSADLLFLPMHDLAPGTRATIVPGKAYEYLATGLPVLAAVPPGDARDFVLSSGTGKCCAPTDVATMSRILETHYTRWWRLGAPQPRADPAFLAAFERRHLTATLAAEFDTLCRKHPAGLAQLS